MTRSNGKKSSAQLGHEVDDILAARQKREARASTRPSGIPSQSEYENRELSLANQQLREVERAPLADRKAAAADFLVAMRDHPQLVADRIGWLLDGNYGYGAMQMAKRVLGRPRMNRSAALTHLIGAFEWQTPSAMAMAGWHKLTKGQQAALEKVVQRAIRDAESNG